METRRRSVAKAISYRLFASIITALIAWGLTSRFSIALQIGLIDGLTKLLGYFLHERAWARIRYGAPRPPEYGMFEFQGGSANDGGQRFSSSPYQAAMSK